MQRMATVLQLAISLALFLTGLECSREDHIQDSVKKLLGLDPGMTGHAKNVSLPPMYMMELYEKYRSGQTPMLGNTVRSILPVKETVGKAELLTFTLFGIDRDEEILQSKLYIFKKKRPKRKKQSVHEFRLNVGCFPNFSPQKSIQVSLPRQKSDWESFDVTESIIKCRRTKGSHEGALAITLEAKRPKVGYRTSNFKRLAKQGSQIFVLVFSDSKLNSKSDSVQHKKDSKDRIFELLGTKIPNPSESQVSHSSDNDQTLSRWQRSRRIDEDYKNRNFSIHESGPINHLTSNHSIRAQSQLSVLNESFTYISKNHPKSNKPFDTTSTELPRGARSISDKNNKVQSKDDTNSLQSVQHKHNHLKSKNSKEKKKKRRKSKLPFWWTKHDSRFHAKDLPSICRRRSLVVDFQELGWGEWIMSPKTFNAYYCTGGCSFPLIQNTRPSNHAVIQSLVHLISSSHQSVASPSCVPSAYKPLTLLYFDERGNLVLKNYNDMIVEKCTCR